MKACERFGCTAAQLNEAFRAHEKKDKSSVVKLGGGFYCAKVAQHWLPSILTLVGLAAGSLL